MYNFWSTVRICGLFIMTYNDLTRKDLQYMQMCYSAATIFSTCGKKKYAAILVDDYGHIVGFGYNGGPRNSEHCEDGGCPRFKEMSPNGSNYDNCIAIHAEANALLHSDYSARPTKIYVNGPPCLNCAKLIANSTIEHVYYVSDSDYTNWEDVEMFLNKAGVHTHKVK
jgi:dCMP deaminase